MTEERERALAPAFDRIARMSRGLVNYRLVHRHRGHLRALGLRTAQRDRRDGHGRSIASEWRRDSRLRVAAHVRAPRSLSRRVRLCDAGHEGRRALDRGRGGRGDVGLRIDVVVRVLRLLRSRGRLGVLEGTRGPQLARGDHLVVERAAEHLDRGRRDGGDTHGSAANLHDFVHPEDVSCLIGEVVVLTRLEGEREALQPVHVEVRLVHRWLPVLQSQGFTSM